MQSAVWLRGHKQIKKSGDSNAYYKNQDKRLYIKMCTTIVTIINR